MLSYSDDNIIIIVTNIAILKLLFAQFVHPGALQVTILSLLTYVGSYKNNDS